MKRNAASPGVKGDRKKAGKAKGNDGGKGIELRPVSSRLRGSGDGRKGGRKEGIVGEEGGGREIRPKCG